MQGKSFPQIARQTDRHHFKLVVEIQPHIQQCTVIRLYILCLLTPLIPFKTSLETEQNSFVKEKEGQPLTTLKDKDGNTYLSEPLLHVLYGFRLVSLFWLWLVNIGKQKSLMWTSKFYIF